MNWLAVGADVVGPAMSFYQAKNREKDAGRKRVTAQAEIDALVDSRQYLP